MKDARGVPAGVLAELAGAWQTEGPSHWTPGNLSPSWPQGLQEIFSAFTNCSSISSPAAPLGLSQEGSGLSRIEAGDLRQGAVCPVFLPLAGKRFFIGLLHLHGFPAEAQLPLCPIIFPGVPAGRAALDQRGSRDKVLSAHH